MEERTSEEYPQVKRRKVDHDSNDEEVAVNEEGNGSKVKKGTGNGHKKKEILTRGKRRVEVPLVRPEGEEREPRLPKRMCAMLLGFCGSPFRGMQYQKVNPGHPSYPTVEGVLFDAMCKAGAISKDNSNDPGKVNLYRAARTDRGVHAAGNVVSVKMITSVPGQGDMLTRINEELPPEIRVWEFVRAKNSFNARTLCDSRRYTYFFPSYLLIPPKPGSGLHQAMERFLGKPWDAVEDPFWTSVDIDKETKEDQNQRKRTWRVTEGHLERLRNISSRYVGTHRFHNFTQTNEMRAETNKRYMKSVEVQETQVHGNTEWISVLFHGQSFMLHQRKMMFVLIMACRTQTPPHLINELYTLRPVLIPKVPALGLLLEAPVYDIYNKNVTTANQKLDETSPDYRPTIDFGKHTEKVEQFKQDFIYSSMRGIEDRTSLFDAWVQSIDAYDGDDLLYFNPEGTVPSVAVIEKGVRRTKRFKEQPLFDRTSFKDLDPDQQIAIDIENASDDEEAPKDKRTAAEMEG